MQKINKKKVYIGIFIFVLLISFHYIGFLRPVENVLVSVSNPASSQLYDLGSRIRLVFKERSSNADLEKRIRDLESERNELLVDRSRMNSLEEENEKLRQHLKFLSTNNFNYLLTHLTSENITIGESQNERNIFIDQGYENGIYEGLPVLNQEGIIIGKISEVHPRSAKVCLTTSGLCKFAATIQNRDKTIGLTSGDKGLTIKMDYIPQTEKVEPGDIVVSSGLEPSIPQGLVIGRVNYISGDTNEIWKSATIDPVVDPDEASIVSVLMP